MLAATVLYADLVGTGGLRAAIRAAEPARRTVDVRVATTPAQLGALDPLVRREVSAALAPVGGRVVAVPRGDPFVPAGTDPAAAKDLVALGSYEAIDAHADLTAGRWAAPGAHPVEATLSDSAAAALHLRVGDRFSLVDIRDTSLRPELVVVGTWAPVDAGDPYWLGSGLELAGSEAGAGFTTRGPLVVDAADLGSGAVTRNVAAEWRGLVPIDALTPDETAALGDGITTLRSRLAAALPFLAQPQVSTDLPALLDAASRSVTVSRSSILLLALQFAVLAVYAILLVAGMLLERRRTESALLRSRGASGGHLVALAAIEALGLALPAVVLAPALAAGLVRVVASVGPAAGAAAGALADPSLGALGPAIVGAAVAGIGAVIALTIPTVASAVGGGSIRSALGRPAGRTFAQRAGLDLALVVVAVIALWQLQTYGAPLTRDARGALGADPLLVAAPAIALIAGALVAIRLLPRLAELAERVLGRARGLVAPLGARQLARRPLRYTRSTLLLVLAVALGTFAAAYGATWSRSQADQAAYESAAPIRAVANDYPRIPAWATASVVRGTPGVTAAAPATRLTVNLGRAVRGAHLLAIDASALPSLAPDLAARQDARGGLAALAAARPAAGVALPGSPARIRISLDTALAPSSEARAQAAAVGQALPDYAATDGVDLAVVVVDATGRLARIPAGTARLAGHGQAIETLLSVQVDGTVARATPPLRLEAVEATLDPPFFVSTVGTVALRGIAVTDEAAGERWTDVALDPAAPDWTWTLAGGSDAGGVPEPSGPPGTIDIPDQPGFGVQTNPGADAPTYRLADTRAANAPVRAIASASFLAASGLEVGGDATLDAGGSDLPIRIVGQADLFAPLDPSVPFLVVDGPTLDAERFATTATPAPVTEWWADAAPGAADAVGRALAAAPFAAKDVVVRSALERALATDPISLGVIGALALGSLAALGFAAIGFVVNASVATSERVGEISVLRALGVSGRQLGAWLVAESVVLLVVGLLGGAALGLVLSAVVLPFASLTASGAPPVPPPAVVVPVEALVPIYAAGVALLLAAIVVAWRQVPPVHVSGVLRARDE